MAILGVDNFTQKWSDGAQHLTNAMMSLETYRTSCNWFQVAPPPHQYLLYLQFLLLQRYLLLLEFLPLQQFLLFLLFLQFQVHQDPIVHGTGFECDDGDGRLMTQINQPPYHTYSFKPFSACAMDWRGNTKGRLQFQLLQRYLLPLGFQLLQLSQRYLPSPQVG
jgi:hypothetical protein